MFRSATTTMIRGVRHLSVARPANGKKRSSYILLAAAAPAIDLFDICVTQL